MSASSPRVDSRPAPALRGYVLTLASAIVLSATGILIKYLLTHYTLGPLALAFWRVLFVSLALGGMLAIFKPSLLRVRAVDLPMFLLYGLVGIGIHQIVWISSVAINGAAIATVLVYIQPALVAVFSWRLLGESLERSKLVALALTLAGMVLVSGVFKLGQLNLSLLGLATGFGTGVTFATYALFSRYATRRYSPWTCLFYAFTFGLLFLLPLQFFSGVDSTPLLGAAAVGSNLFVLGGSPGGWGVLLLLALGPTLAGFALYTMGLSHLPASVATIIGTLEPVFSIVLAYLMFGEVLDVLQLGGAALILWSVVMLRPGTKASPGAAEPALPLSQEP